MAPRKALLDSIRTAQPQKPSVRLSDIAIAYVIAPIFVVGVEFLGLIVFATLAGESANDILTLGALLFVGAVSSFGFGGKPTLDSIPCFKSATSLIGNSAHGEDGIGRWLFYLTAQNWLTLHNATTL